MQEIRLTQLQPVLSLVVNVGVVGMDLPNQCKLRLQVVQEFHQGGDVERVDLLLADIDHFKKVNDNYGHHIGDMVIKHFATSIAQSVRSTDFVARYGGEEFAVVLPSASIGNAIGVAERVRQSLAQTSWAGILPASANNPTGSFGIAEVLDGETPAQLFERADRMLYSAKRLGRDRIEHDSAALAEHDRKGTSGNSDRSIIAHSEQLFECRSSEVQCVLKSAKNA